MASGCSLVDMLAAFLLPGVDQKIHALIVVPCAIAEIWMVCYLLVVGVRAVRPERRVLAVLVAS